MITGVIVMIAGVIVMITDVTVMINKTVTALAAVFKRVYALTKDLIKLIYYTRSN